MHTLSLIYQLILELAIAEDPSADLSSSASEDEDEEDAARNEALGLGGAKLKAVLSEITKNDMGVSSGASGISVKGGEVLTIIYERMQNMSGDPTATKVYTKLLTAAGRPYVEMIRAWVATGRLMDPHEELLVKESKFIDRGILEMDYTDEYWERRYTVTIYSIFLRADVDSCLSYAMGQYPLGLQNDIKLEYHHLGLWVVDYLEVLACHLCWRVGNTRSCWLENISTSFGNVGSRCHEIKIILKMRIYLWMMKGGFIPLKRMCLADGFFFCSLDSTNSLRMRIPMPIVPYFNCY